MTPRPAASHATPALRCFVVTGADSGLGRAVADRLASEGRVITSGLGETSTFERISRRTMVAEGSSRPSLSQHRVDGVVAVAGAGAPRPETVALNYFGAVAVLDGLRSCLVSAEAPAAVVVSSSASLHRGSNALVRACLAGDEERALAIAARLIRTRRGSQIYRSSKIALNLWVRSAAVQAQWAETASCSTRSHRASSQLSQSHAPGQNNAAFWRPPCRSRSAPPVRSHLWLICSRTLSQPKTFHDRPGHLLRRRHGCPNEEGTTTVGVPAVPAS